MFSGEFPYRIDEKGRLPLPPRFRAAFDDGVVLAPGFEKCIVARTPAEWKKVADDLTVTSLSPSKMRKLNRALFALSFTINLDGQGRVALPQPLRDYAGIRNDVVIAGANSYLEIWDKTSWEEEKAVSQQQAWQIIEGLEKR